MTKGVAASIASMFALCGGAPVSRGEEVDFEEVEFTAAELELTGAITAQNPNDYFLIWNLEPRARYAAELDVSNLALIAFSDDFAEVIDSSFDEFPLQLPNLKPNSEGRLFLAVCATAADGSWTLEACDEGVIFNDSYRLTLPEPGAGALRLAALLCLAGLSRARAKAHRRAPPSFLCDRSAHGQVAPPLHRTPHVGASLAPGAGEAHRSH